MNFINNFILVSKTHRLHWRGNNKNQKIKHEIPIQRVNQHLERNAYPPFPSPPLLSSSSHILPLPPPFLSPNNPSRKPASTTEGQDWISDSIIPRDEEREERDSVLGPIPWLLLASSLSSQLSSCESHQHCEYYQYSHKQEGDPQDLQAPYYPCFHYSGGPVVRFPTSNPLVTSSQTVWPWDRSKAPTSSLPSTSGYKSTRGIPLSFSFPSRPYQWGIAKKVGNVVLAFAAPSYHVFLLGMLIYVCC